MAEKITIVAPGRTEICGNHTDHQNGKVLAAAISLNITAEIEKDESGLVTLVSDGSKIKAVDTKDLAKKNQEEGTSEGLIRGVLFYLKEKGYKVGGFSGNAVSTVLRGSGLSSSAAFEVFIGRAISTLYNDGKIDPLTIAMAGQFAENEYFGKPCGLMDQCACSFQKIIAIDFEDPQNAKVEQIIPKKDMDIALCIIDTKGSHADLTDDYAAIRREMNTVASFFGKNVLREVKESDFYEALEKGDIYKKCSDRAVLRAIHFFEEEKRVSFAKNALIEGNKEAFYRVIKESGDSSYKYLQNVYSPAHPENQGIGKCLCLCEQILGSKGVARVHGGGFAGTVQVFCDKDYIESFKAKIERYFGENSCQILEIV